MSISFRKHKLTKFEPSISHVPVCIWTNREHHTVACICNDGVAITGNLQIMAYRSPYFCDVLEQDKASTNNHVPIHFPGQIIQAVLEYLHTNQSDYMVELALPQQNNNHALVNFGKVPEQPLRQLLELLLLSEAAAMFHLSLLVLFLQDEFIRYLQCFPLLSLIIVEACTIEGPMIAPNVQEFAFYQIHVHYMSSNRLVQPMSPRQHEHDHDDAHDDDDDAY